MSGTVSSHLTDEQINEYLLFGTAPGECENHLETCALCQDQVSLFRDSVHAFNRATLGWSEAQPEISLRGRVREQQIRSFTYPLRWAIAAAAVLSIGLPLAQREAHQASARGQAASPLAMQDSVAQIQSDNQLMQSVDVALADSDPSPMAEYGLASPGEGDGRLHSGEKMQ